MAVEQIRLRTLLKEDEFYRKWFMKPPKIKVSHHTPPWRLMVQKEKGGRWYLKDLPEYAQAFGVVKLRLSEYWDMTIHCKPQGFKPPVLKISGKRIWAPMPLGHRWCMYCRRPTVFRCFRKHPNSKLILSIEEERCSICGARATPMPTFQSTELWPLHAAQSSP